MEGKLPKEVMCFLCFPGLLCFLIGMFVIVLNYWRPKQLKAFFDLCEDEEEGGKELGEVYVNPQLVAGEVLVPPSDFRLTVKNI